jgi:hypothetical protein
MLFFAFFRKKSKFRASVLDRHILLLIYLYYVMGKALLLYLVAIPHSLVPPPNPANLFRIRTYEKCACNPFRINTYKSV